MSTGTGTSTGLMSKKSVILIICHNHRPSDLMKEVAFSKFQDIFPFG
jgi:hypothetical protein